jgi:malate dehydrogenase (oxaloacetate-decarboxylating)
MARKSQRPIIFPLSNPTDKSEATPDDLIRWTAGRALIAVGSPFPPVSYGGRQMSIAQCNNAYIFPAVGLGVVAARAKRITDGMMLAAAQALAESSPTREDPAAPLLPLLADARNAAIEVAVAVAEAAQRDGVAPGTNREQLRRKVSAAQWAPAYSPFV